MEVHDGIDCSLSCTLYVHKGSATLGASVFDLHSIDEQAGIEFEFLYAALTYG